MTRILGCCAVLVAPAAANVARGQWRISLLHRRLLVATTNRCGGRKFEAAAALGGS